MRIIACDPGLADLGYGIVDLDGREWTHVASGVIVTQASQPLSVRLAEIASDLSQIVTMYDPDAAAYERVTVTVGKGSGTAMALMSAGVIAAVFGAAGLPTVEYPPQSWKAGVVPRHGGGGRAKKPDVQAAVRDLLGLDYLPSPEHAADALAIAIHRGMRMDFDAVA